ncbi:winged helix-turn-helix transcriptional regulator [Altererythrobacter arenosus]|uniref:Winged helix-turn-helix transcriptional regulator n=1 Tax=Altererythrobacter arenosus TaxID=3032592 RepID=A0ABY8FRY8_9SPHN|nr:winged helix-turn-helix transcriptional regulator [Altererythrobacter sp. CAU 1644]WFL77612.1 winged helix-turn-helix transcriptional regulator [Altererythrobacter sp. CAU 1644]
MKLQKETKLHGRWYNDACGTAFGLELLGERWSMLVVRELMLGPRRFSDLRASLPGISAKTLTERLTMFEEAGMLVRRRFVSPVPVQAYELTEWGYRAEPVLQELGRWAAMSPGHDPLLPLSPVSFMLSLRTMFDPEKAKGIEARIGFDIGGETFLARMKDGALPIRRDDLDEAQAVFEVPTAPVLAGLFYANVPVEELEREARLTIRGDRKLALRFADIFELPEKLG